jgi:hypothetical protein
VELHLTNGWFIDTEDKATDYEKHKQDQLDKQKSGKGHWKPELASNSEEAVCFS